MSDGLTTCMFIAIIYLMCDVNIKHYMKSRLTVVFFFNKDGGCLQAGYIVEQQLNLIQYQKKYKSINTSS